MILTTCAACAAPLAHNAPRCVRCKLRYGETLLAANNYAGSLNDLEHFEEARSLMLKTMPVARRVLGESHPVSPGMRWLYAKALYLDAVATLADLREAVSTLEEMERTARRVFGSAHPLVATIEAGLREALLLVVAALRGA